MLYPGRPKPPPPPRKTSLEGRQKKKEEDSIYQVPVVRNHKESGQFTKEIGLLPKGTELLHKETGLLGLPDTPKQIFPQGNTKNNYQLLHQDLKERFKNISTHNPNARTKNKQITNASSYPSSNNLLVTTVNSVNTGLNSTTTTAATLKTTTTHVPSTTLKITATTSKPQPPPIPTTKPRISVTTQPSGGINSSCIRPPVQINKKLSSKSDTSPSKLQLNAEGNPLDSSVQFSSNNLGSSPVIVATTKISESSPLSSNRSSELAAVRSSEPLFVKSSEHAPSPCMSAKSFEPSSTRFTDTDQSVKSSEPFSIRSSDPPPSSYSPLRSSRPPPPPGVTAAAAAAVGIGVTNLNPSLDLGLRGMSSPIRPKAPPLLPVRTCNIVPTPPPVPSRDSLYANIGRINLLFMFGFWIGLISFRFMFKLVRFGYLFRLVMFRLVRLYLK